MLHKSVVISIYFTLLYLPYTYTTCNFYQKHIASAFRHKLVTIYISILACTTGVIFSRFSGERRKAPVERGRHTRARWEGVFPCRACHFYINLTFCMLVNIHFPKWSKATVTDYDETIYTNMWTSWKLSCSPFYRMLSCIIFKFR